MSDFKCFAEWWFSLNYFNFTFLVKILYNIYKYKKLVKWLKSYGLICIFKKKIIKTNINWKYCVFIIKFSEKNPISLKSNIDFPDWFVVGYNKHIFGLFVLYSFCCIKSSNGSLIHSGWTIILMSLYSNIALSLFQRIVRAINGFNRIAHRESKSNFSLELSTQQMLIEWGNRKCFWTRIKGSLSILSDLKRLKTTNWKELMCLNG